MFNLPEFWNGISSLANWLLNDDERGRLAKPVAKCRHLPHKIVIFIDFNSQVFLSLANIPLGLFFIFFYFLYLKIKHYKTTYRAVLTLTTLTYRQTKIKIKITIYSINK